MCGGFYGFGDGLVFFSFLFRRKEKRKEAKEKEKPG